MKEFIERLRAYFSMSGIAFSLEPTIKDVAVHGADSIISAAAIPTVDQPWGVGGYRPRVDLYIGCNLSKKRDDGSYISVEECIDEIMSQWRGFFDYHSISPLDVRILFDDLQSGGYYGRVTITDQMIPCT